MSDQRGKWKIQIFVGENWKEGEGTHLRCPLSLSGGMPRDQTSPAYLKALLGGTSARTGGACPSARKGCYRGREGCFPFLAS